MVDYSRFDHIDFDSDDENEKNVIKNPPPGAVKKAVTPMTKKGKDGRLRFEYEGRTIYEWEQTIDEVNIYISPPPDISRNMLKITIVPHHLTVGLIGAPPFIDEDTGGPIISDESTWVFVDGIITITLQKMYKASPWDSALAGRNGQTVDAVTKEEIKKKMMLERFQEEVSNRFFFYVLIRFCTHIILS